MSEQHSTDFARQLELAWAAGFFDGEGNTSLDVNHASGLSYIRLTVSQVVVANLERFKAALGYMGHVEGPFPRPDPNHQPISRYRINGHDARLALKLMWPYLGQVKKDQATAVLEAENNKGGVRSAWRMTCPQGHEYSPRRDGRGRKCKICDAARTRAKHKKMMEERGPLPVVVKTHCPQGHPYADGYIRSDGYKRCRVCERESCRRQYEKRKERKRQELEGD